MSAEPTPVFVERRTYRRRRIADAARLMPVLGGVLICVPLLWGGQEAAPARTSLVMFYFFGLWVALVVVSAVISRYLRPDINEEGTGG